MAQGDETKRLADVTVGEAKRAAFYAAATLLALFLFVLLLGEILVALLLGVVAGAYLLPVQEWLERRLRARAGSALITIALILVPLAVTVGYGWHELSGYSTAVEQRREQIIEGISRSLSEYVAVENTRAALQTAFSEAVLRSGEAIAEFRKRSALLLVSAILFFFTLFYVLTQRIRLAAYIKLRVPGDFLPFYERLAENVGGALRGALLAVMVDQTLKALLILVLNFSFGVPLAVVLALVVFLVGFFPLLGEWTVYIPVSVYLLVFRDEPRAAVAYLLVGAAITACSTLVVRPKLAAHTAQRFNYYWMLVGLVAGVYAFGIPGIVLGPAILGFAKAIMDTLVGEVKYETSLLKEERTQQADTQQKETDDNAAGTTLNTRG
ncbi:MAG TPA: AI-2E family transporter [Pyrinomonadaceae bacterium]|jgi:predicted PurR-regulated permease PerM|nr:AI-2E family transporter [Pyrinomonadaceae bacterium]